MVFSLTWLAPVLKGAGLKVAPDFGWESRGLGDVGEIVGVICHHTETADKGNFPTHHLLVHGRAAEPGVPALKGPLAQLGLGRDGTFYLIAAGKCQHAGTGEWKGFTAGNTHFVGIEAENRGDGRDPWPDVQLDAYHRGVAAILKHVGRGTEFCVGHKEWARDRKPPQPLKHDPALDMNEFRAAVAAVLNGTAPAPTLIPAAEPTGAGRPTLRRGDEGELVATVQQVLGITPTSTHFGPKTEAALRTFQGLRGVVPDGIVGPKTWAALDAAAKPASNGASAGAPAGGATVAAGGAAPGAGAAAGAAAVGGVDDAVEPGLAWGAKVSPEFKAKVRKIAAGLGCEPNYLMACMAFESGETFSPGVRNAAGSGAVGLIQFMPSTAKGLGTTSEALAGMSAESQLEFVEKYFKGQPPVRTLEDVYMAILWPRAVGKPNDYVLFAAPSVQYHQNRGLDRDRDGAVTKAEAAAAVGAKLARGLGAPFFG
jgi:hypothetical protein